MNMSTLDFDEDGLAPERSQASSVLGVRNALSPPGRSVVAKTPITENRPSLAHSSGPLVRLAQLQARHTALLDGIESAQRSAERLAQICVEKEEQADAAEQRARAALEQEESAAQKLASLKAEYDTTSELLSRCAEGLEAQHSALALAEQATEQAQARTAEVERQEQEAQQRAEEVEREIAAVSARLEEARAREVQEIEEATKRRQKLDKEFAEAQEESKRVLEEDRTQLELLQHEVDSTAATLRETQRSLEAARKELMDVQDQQKAFQASRDQAQREDALLTDIEGLQKTNEDLRLRTAELESILKRESARADGAVSEVEKAMVRSQLLEQIVEALKDQAVTLRGALQDARSEAQAWRESVMHRLSSRRRALGLPLPGADVLLAKSNAVTPKTDTFENTSALRLLAGRLTQALLLVVATPGALDCLEGEQRSQLQELLGEIGLKPSAVPDAVLHALPSSGLLALEGDKLSEAATVPKCASPQRLPFLHPFPAVTNCRQ